MFSGAVERLACVIPVRASAASAHRPEVSETFCGADKIALAESEQRRRSRNRCGERKTSQNSDGGSWATFDGCEAAFMSCRARGGHRWPGQSSRLADLRDCDGGQIKIPVAEIA